MVILITDNIVWWKYSMHCLLLLAFWKIRSIGNEIRIKTKCKQFLGTSGNMSKSIHLYFNTFLLLNFKCFISLSTIHSIYLYTYTFEQLFFIYQAIHGSKWVSPWREEGGRAGLMNKCTCVPRLVPLCSYWLDLHSMGYFLPL